MKQIIKGEMERTFYSDKEFNRIDMRAKKRKERIKQNKKRREEIKNG